MLGSNEKISFINEYINAYQSKINMANKYGLFDAAKMFELFAVHICGLWFGQKFTNLNIENSTYPYVDLVSEDNQIFVQVSTVQDIPTKIKKTLEKIRDSDDERFLLLNKVIFFVLSNDSIDKVQDYSGDKKIGQISFSKKENLITTRNIINKAENDSEFLNSLYDVLTREFNRFEESSERLNEAIDFSRKIGLKNISGLINGEYEIDRSKNIKQIKEANEKFVMITGQAGSGKSALCKKIVENEDIVLYARAERFLEETEINGIWKCDIKAVLEYLNGKKIVFFIDALEFIADYSDTKFELLQYLYEIVSDYENAFILTSCRSNDKSAFMILESNYNVKSYEVVDLTINELLLIMGRYPVIRKMYEMKSYSDLLRSPFYINLIVSRGVDIDDIRDESSLRDYIWEKIICLQGGKRKYKITYQSAVEVIMKIVFDRARNFSLGIREDEINGNIVEALISEDIVVKQGRENRGYIRLKYDIYEDICFENYFDKEFELCKGEYPKFYEKIEQLGRCVYRRYQIWISNKLFIQSNRDKFLGCLVFSDDILQKWKRQTEIGIVKSRFCNCFFEEYSQDIIDSEIILEFIKIINLFAFEARIIAVNEVRQMYLLPIGSGRTCIIKIIESEQLYKKDIIRKEEITKLCRDYAKQKMRDNVASKAACSIMEYFIEMAEESEIYYHFIDAIKPCLEVIYNMADVSFDWVKEFWRRLLENSSINERKLRIAEDTIEWTLKNAYPVLFGKLAKEICLLADKFWLGNKENKYRYFDFDSFNGYREYGLSENADFHDSSYRNVYQNTFLVNLFSENIREGFQWAIRFVNCAVSEYANNNSNSIYKIKIMFLDSQTDCEYWGNPYLWVTGVVENRVPALLGDIIFCLKKEILNRLELLKHDKKQMFEFANFIKKILYTESNNIALLSIIEAIGFHFEGELPGYALDLITCMEIIRWDTSRYVLYVKDFSTDMLEKHILISAGIPNIKKRYELDEKCDINIQQYVSNAQLYFDSVVKEKCYKILDYLYSIIPNDNENAVNYLQIQKMDLRGAKKVQISNSIVRLEPNITGAAEEVIQKKKLREEPINKFENIIKRCNESVSNGEADLNLIFLAMDKLLEIMDDSGLHIQYDDAFIKLIVHALSSEELQSEDRSKLCSMWIAGVNQLILNGNFLFDLNLFPILLKQMDFEISTEIKKELKSLVISCLMNEQQNGLVDRLRLFIKQYLLGNKELARKVFYTIIKLAEDEMEHQKYNADYIMNNGVKQDFVYLPNMQPKLFWVEQYIQDKGGEIYNSKKKEIFNKYLFNNEELRIEQFDMCNYDISTLICVVNCGLNFKNNLFWMIIHNILTCMIDIWKKHEGHGNSYKIINLYHQQELINLYQREMVQSVDDAKSVIDTLFNDIDFSKFTLEAIDFYKDIFGNFLPEYFDAYADKKRRRNCENKIKYIEQKVLSIDSEYVRLQLYQSLMLSVTRYCYGDWSKCQTSYSDRDMRFLNEQFTKYGKYHIEKMLETIYQLRIEELLPDILISIKNSFQEAKVDRKKFARAIQEQKSIVNMIILKAYVQYNGEIKQNNELIVAFEDILETLIDQNFEEAAIILDEFRIH